MTLFIRREDLYAFFSASKNGALPIQALNALSVRVSERRRELTVIELFTHSVAGQSSGTISMARDQADGRQRHRGLQTHATTATTPGKCIWQSLRLPGRARPQERFISIRLFVGPFLPEDL